MDLQKANSNDATDCINLYKGKSNQELEHIQPKWAYGENADKLLDYIQAPAHNTYTIFCVDPFELIQNSDLNEVNPNILFTGEMINDYRVAESYPAGKMGYLLTLPQ